MLYERGSFHIRKPIMGLRYPGNVLLTCAFIVAMLASFAFSESAFAAERSPSAASQHSTSAIPLALSCGNQWRGIVRVSKHTLYYGTVVTCTGGNAARIAVTLTVQILNGSSWVVNAAQSASCNDCSTLRAPSGIGSYSYTGAPNQHVRVAITFGVTASNGSREGESGIAGPYVFS